VTAPARDVGVAAPSLADSPELIASPTEDLEIGKKPGFLYTRLGMLVVRVATAVLIFGGWEWYGQGVSKALLVPPSRIVTEAYDMLFIDGRLVGALQISVGTMLIGLFLSIIIGIPLGMIMGRFKTIESVLDPYVLFLYVLPSVAFVPVFVVMVGIDIKLRLALIIMSAVFPLIINTIAGVKHVDSELIDGGKAFKANEWQIMRTILIPGSLPFIFAGLRIGFSAAWVGAIVAEMTALITGVGGLLLDSSSKYRTAEVFVSIFAIMAVAVTIQWFTARLEIWLTPWARAGNEIH
jgi:ABC-type nitrate/sulfonate/bicarbonate transport system permease component